MDLDAIKSALQEEESIDRWVHPLAKSYESLIAQLTSADSRFRLGIAAVDLLTRGFGPKELVICSGFAHSSKTQLVLTGILHNPDKRVLFFSLDDPAEMILLKLCAMHHGVPGDEMERRIRQGDETAKALLLSTLSDYPNLLIVDDSLGERGMTQALKEAEAHWDGKSPQLVVLDYLELLADSAGDETSVVEDVKAVAKKLKRWIKKRDFPLLVVHQNTRSRGAPGEPITMLSMAHGGEQEATIVLGVRRKRDNEKYDAWEREAHKDTVTVHVVKNKRPPAKITPPDGVDLFIDPLTGMIRPLRESDYRPGLKLPEPTLVETTAQALAQAQERMEEA